MPASAMHSKNPPVLFLEEADGAGANCRFSRQHALRDLTQNEANADGFGDSAKRSGPDSRLQAAPHRNMKGGWTQPRDARQSVMMRFA